MKTTDVRTIQDVTRIVEARDLRHVKVGVFDVDGVMRGKYMSRDKFVSAAVNGFGFCNVVLGWDSNDQLYDNVKFTGWHTGYPDASVRIIPETCRELPFEDDGLLFIGEFMQPADAICPRGTLRRVLDRARQMGLTARAGFEYEFFVFDETPDSVREKHYRNLQPMAPGCFGYSMIRNSVHADFYRSLLDLCERMRMPIEGLHEETGPGVIEAALSVDEGLAAADKAALFKTFIKVLAQRQGRMATFMAKWSPDWPGQSGHIHISLLDPNGTNAFYDAQSEHGMSRTMRHFIGGQQKLMPELCAMIAPTVNSYTRLIPGFWAPTDASYGVDNRTCALRVIPAGKKSQRVEFRVAAADANPYISLAAAIGAGLWGIENEIEPEAPVAGNAYEQRFPRRLSLPRSLGVSADRLSRSKPARELFGDAFVDHYAASREWEEREFHRAVTDWEMQRYFEII